MRVVDYALDRAIRGFNAIVRTTQRDVEATSDPDLQAIRTRARTGTDISSHLETLYLEATRAKPKLIVELGVRTGESTFIFAKVARKTGATLVSCDIDPCASASDYDKWHFVREDDVAFGKRFGTWCQERNLPATVDALFIDTSHLYEHTLAEMDAWFPHLSKGAVVFFHDTNLNGFFRRRDYTIGQAWSNERGVIRAIETRLGATFDERRPFHREVGSWEVVHDPVCCGLTILKRKATSGA